jgi:hypothetical protein
MKFCAICNQQFELLESHHIKPTSLGGDINGPQVLICSNCHTGIHSEAKAAISKNPSNKSYFTPLVFQKALPYIQEIIKASLEFNREENPNNIRKITIILKDHELVKLHKLKLDAGFKSLDEYLPSLIRAIINKNI